MGMVTPTASCFGRYQLLKYLGSGGMSDVFVALHTGLRKRVALKMLRPSLRHDPQAVERFSREGECAARVSHPNVVDVTDVGVQDGVPFLVMELLDGETLADRLEREGRLSPSAAIDVMLPILDGVAAIHAAGVVHRDIKPANVLLARSADGSVVPKLVDFGIATVEERRNITGALGPIGTPHYMAPEQARGVPGLDPRSDQYSLASMLFECVTGREPFSGPDATSVMIQVARGRFPRLHEVAKDLPAALDDVLARATELDPRRRFSSTAEFAHALLPFASARTRRLWVSRDARNGVFSAQLLSGVWRMDEDSGELDDPGATTRIVRRPRPPKSKLLFLAGVAALGLFAGLSVGAAHGMSVLGAVKAERASPLGPATHPSVAGPVLQRPLAASAQRIVHVEPSQAEIHLDGVLVGHGAFVAPRFDGAEVHELRISAEGFITRVMLFRGALEGDAFELEAAH
jgi:serine/threonine protein kinase